MIYKPFYLLSMLASTSLLSSYVTVAAENVTAANVAAKNYVENKGVVAIEAEDFASQHLAEQRRWLRFNKTSKNHPYPDNDAIHADNASGDSYIELLPDTRTNHDEELIVGENFSDIPGYAALLSYPVYFHTAGKYYVWARAYSTGSEDNGIHFGLNGQWPESGQRLQLCQGKNQWTWSSAQRDIKDHCGVAQSIYLDIPYAGLHTINISMREDGFELDKFILTQDKNFTPEGVSVAASYQVDQPLSKKNMLHDIVAYQLILLAGKDFAYGDNNTHANTNNIPYYHHKDKQALAINAGNKAYRNTFASAVYTVKNIEPQPYDLTLVTLAEIDGESKYQLKLNGKLIGEFQNPETAIDYQESYFTIKNIALQLGDVIEVSSMAVTNGKIPEHDETAYARGRWRAVVLSKASE